MYAQVSAVAAAPTKNDMTEINRRSANFHPSIWGYYIKSIAFLQALFIVKLAQLASNAIFILCYISFELLRLRLECKK
jgi:hypothetical protein